jgi:hypothetical protein
LIETANGQIQKGDVAAAIASLEQALAIEPTRRETLVVLIALIQQHAIGIVQSGDTKAGYAMFMKASGHARTLMTTYPELNEQERNLASNALYNEACAYGVGGEPQKALSSLKDAFGAGFSDLALVERDSDLASVRSLPEFKLILEEQATKAREKAREEAKRLLAANQPFPFSFALPDLDGKTVSLADFKDKVLIVDIWGTWCPPCRMEVPHFIEL